VVDWCGLCKKSGEIVAHLLIHCETTSALWKSIFGLFGLAWVMLRQVRDLFACWRGQFGSAQSEAVFRMIFRMIPLMLCIWREVIEALKLVRG
jgi:hypothetical protein